MPEGGLARGASGLVASWAGQSGVLVPWECDCGCSPQGSWAPTLHWRLGHYLGVTCNVSNCFWSSIVTFLASKVTCNIVFLCQLYIKKVGDQNFSVSCHLASKIKS